MADEAVTATAEAAPVAAEVVPVTAAVEAVVAPAEAVVAADATQAVTKPAPEPTILDGLAPPPEPKPDEPKAEPAEPAADVAPVPAEPITFEPFAVPEGLSYNEEAAAPFLGVLAGMAAKTGMSKEDAQAFGQSLVALHAEKLMGAVEAIRAEAQAQVEAATAAAQTEAGAELQKISDQRKSWERASLDEFGKQRDTVLTTAKAGANAFLDGSEGSTELTDFYGMLRETGAGNHPLMIRYLNRVGSAVAKQATLAPGSGQAAKVDSLTAMYGPKSK